MATVRPFTAWVPPADLSAEIASVPYDVIDSQEARALAVGKAWSYLHVIRPEIDLPAGTDEHDDVVYQQGRAAVERWIQTAPYGREQGRLFVYRLTWQGRDQIGVVATCSIDEYDSGRIAVHERTRKDKEDDRARHVLTMRCQAEPIFLAYRARKEVDALVAEVMVGAPRFDFVSEDGIRHTLWDVPDAPALSAAFAAVPTLYVADGHHRAKSASRAREALRVANPEHRGDEDYNFVLSVLFPDDQLRILPYHRVVKDLSGKSPEAVRVELGARFTLRPDVGPSPTAPHEVHLFADGRWYGFNLPTVGSGVLNNLDVSLLQEEVLRPLLHIDDPRTDPKIDFVGGIRGTAELERRAMAASGVAFSMFPTSMAELFAVSDQGLIMPPKSTWFEPKLRSGLFIHRI